MVRAMAPLSIVALEGDPDLGGDAGTIEFTDEVISRVRAKLE